MWLKMDSRRAGTSVLWLFNSDLLSQVPDVAEVKPRGLDDRDGHQHRHLQKFRFYIYWSTNLAQILLVVEWLAGVSGSIPAPSKFYQENLEFLNWLGVSPFWKPMEDLKNNLSDAARQSLISKVVGQKSDNPAQTWNIVMSNFAINGSSRLSRFF